MKQIDPDLLYCHGYELRQLFLRKELSPVTFMHMALRQAARANAAHNCLTQIFDQWSLRAAADSERRFQTRQAIRPLEGIPLLVKSEAGLKGSRQDYGSLLHENYKDKTTDVHIQRLISAGAIPIAKTTVPEYSILATTHSRLQGVTTNPWLVTASPGGSTGGGGAALAAGVAPYATASDIGGSARIPAAWSGVVGYKPPYGRIPNVGPWGLNYYCHIGAMARSVQDICDLMAVMAGLDYLDPASLGDKPDYTLPANADVAGKKILMVQDWNGAFPVDKEILDNMTAVAKTFESLGAVVEAKEITLPKYFYYYAWIGMAHVTGASLARVINTPQEKKLSDYARAHGIFSKQTTGYDAYIAETNTTELAKTFNKIFKHYDFILTPMTARVMVSADYHHKIFYEKMMAGDFHNLKEILCEQPEQLGPIFNSQSRCPVIAMPSGFANNGMPTGVQLAGRPYAEQQVLTAAYAYEKTQQWYQTKRPTIG